jgi:hypothetical protein
MYNELRMSTRRKIATKLRGRQKVPDTWNLDEVRHAERCKFSPGDLVATTRSFVISFAQQIDGHPVLTYDVPVISNDHMTINGADFAVYLGVERLRVTRRMPGKGWSAARDNELVHELHHILLVNDVKVVCPQEMFNDLTSPM